LLLISAPFFIFTGLFCIKPGVQAVCPEFIIELSLFRIAEAVIGSRDILEF
jgi:hypothetical protein